MPSGVYKRKKTKETIAVPAPKVIPALPAGCSIVDRTPTMELNTRSNAKWMTIIQAIRALPAEKAFEIDISGCNPSRINTIRASLRKAAKDMGLNQDGLRFSIDGSLNKLHTWANW